MATPSSSSLPAESYPPAVFSAHKLPFQSLTRSTSSNIVQFSSLSVTNSQSMLQLMSIGSVMPSNHLIFWHSFLLPSIFPSIRVFSNESALHIRWPKYWNFSFSISPSNEYSGLVFFRIDWFDLLASLALNFLYVPTLTSIYDYWQNTGISKLPSADPTQPTAFFGVFGTHLCPLFHMLSMAT